MRFGVESYVEGVNNGDRTDLLAGKFDCTGGDVGSSLLVASIDVGFGLHGLGDGVRPGVRSKGS